jgi:hypothetical protein
MLTSRKSSLVRKHFWRALEAIIESINNRQKIPYGKLADKLGLKIARQDDWSGLLDAIARKTDDDVGYDLTWNVVYASGPAKGLGRYFRNRGEPPGSTLLDPQDRAQVAKYNRKLKEIYEHTYKLERVENKDIVIKVRQARR